MNLLLKLTAALLLLLAHGAPSLASVEQPSSADAAQIHVQLRLVTAEEIAIYFGSGKPRKDAFYIFGMVTNSGADRAAVQLEIWSPNNPAINVKNIAIGWISPNRLAAEYFLESIGQPPLKTAPKDVQLAYRITSVTTK